VLADCALAEGCQEEGGRVGELTKVLSILVGLLIAKGIGLVHADCTEREKGGGVSSFDVEF